MDHFTFWLSLSLRPDWDQTAELRTKIGVQINQSPHRKLRVYSLIVIADVIADFAYFFIYLWISEKVKWFSFIKT